MICENDIFKCFESLRGSKRVRLLHQLLHMCHPLELRFIASCVEAACQSSYAGFNHDYISANNPGSLRILTNPIDCDMRRTLLIYMCLLRSNNKLCSVILYEKLVGSKGLYDYCNYLLQELTSRGNLKSEDEEAVEELVLLYTMAALHPAFEFSDRYMMLEVYRKFDEIFTFSRFMSLHCSPKDVDSSFKARNGFQSDVETSQLTNGTAAVHKGSTSGHNGSTTVHNGSSTVHNGSAPGHNGSFIVHNGSAPVHNGSAKVRNGSATVHNGSTPGHNGSTAVHNDTASTHNICSCFNQKVHICSLGVVTVCADSSDTDVLLLKIIWSDSRQSCHLHVTVAQLQSLHDKLVQEARKLPTPLLFCPDRATIASQPSVYVDFLGALVTSSASPLVNVVYSFFRQMSDERSSDSRANFHSSRSSEHCSLSSDIGSDGTDPGTVSDGTAAGTRYWRCRYDRCRTRYSARDTNTDCSSDGTACQQEFTNGVIAESHNPSHIKNGPHAGATNGEAAGVSCDHGSTSDPRSSQIIDSASDCVAVKLDSVRLSSSDPSPVNSSGDTLILSGEPLPTIRVNYPGDYVHASTATLATPSGDHASESSPAVLLSSAPSPSVPVVDSRVAPALSVICPPDVGYFNYPLPLMSVYGSPMPLVISPHAPSPSSELHPPLSAPYCSVARHSPALLPGIASAALPVRGLAPPVTFYQHVPPPSLHARVCCHCGRGGHIWRHCEARESAPAPTNHCSFRLELNPNCSARDR